MTKSMVVLRYDLNPDDVGLVIEWARRASVDGVMVFTGGPDQYARPHTVAEAKAWVDAMVPVAKRLQRAELRFEINVWCTLGHGGGIPWVTEEGFQPQVGSRGERLEDAVCPLDPQWVERVRTLYALYAELNPQTLWIDDDFRHHNHAPAAWTCFCPRHLDQMGQRTGRPWTRLEVVEGISEGQEGVEQVWKTVLNQGISDLAQAISDAVDRVSQTTVMGLMTSSPEVHDAEGREWNDLLAALSPRHPAQVRPTLGNYRGGDPRDLVEGSFLARRTRRLVGEHVVRPEVESYPYGRWNKANRYLRLQMLVSAAYGMDQYTLNLFPYGGIRPDFDDGLISTVQEVLAVRAEIRKRLGGEWIEHGVGAPLKPTVDSRFSPSMYQHQEVRTFEFGLALLGIPIAYEGRMPVNELNASVVAALSDEDLSSYFADGVILDAKAALAVVERGLQALVPVDIGTVFESVAQENLVATGRMLRDCRIDRVALRRLSIGTQAQVKTVLMGSSQRVLGPGMVWFENLLGGRVVVVADDGAAGGLLKDTWRNQAWQQLWSETVVWLSRGRTEGLLQNAPNAVPVVIEGQGGTMLAVINLGFDPLAHIECLWARPFEAVHRLTERTWEDVLFAVADHPTGMVALRLDSSVSPMEVAWFWISHR